MCHANGMTGPTFASPRTRSVRVEPARRKPGRAQRGPDNGGAGPAPGIAAVLRRRWPLVVLCLLGMTGLGVQPVSAALSAPDHIVYGTATWYGEPVTDGVVSLILDGQPGAVAHYELGSDPTVGTMYVLRVPMDSVDPRRPGTARPGDQGTLMIDDAPAGSVVIGERGAAQLLDVDPEDAEATPVLSIDDVAVEEGDVGTVLATLTISLSVTTDDTVTVDWVTDNGTATGGGDCLGGADFVADSGVATVNPGDSSTTVDVTVCGETLEESDEAFFVNLLNPGNAALLDPQGKATILDDDTPPGLSVNNVTVTEPSTGSVMASFRVSLSRLWDAEVSFDYATSGGSATAGADYLSTSGNASIPVGSLETIIEVEVLADVVDEDEELFYLDVSNPVNGTILDGSGQGTIVDASQFLIFVEAEVDGIAGVDGLAGATDAAFSPDGEHVYALGGSEDALVVFERDGTSGAISILETYLPGSFENRFTEAFVGMDGPEGVVVSPDGAHVYVAAYNDDSVAVFERSANAADPDYGRLQLLEVERDGINDLGDSGGTVDGLDGATALAVSPDGAFLYVVGAQDDAVAVFERNTDQGSPAFGTLTFVEAETDGVDDLSDVGGTVEGLDRASGVAVSPDGLSVYVTGAGDRAVAVFDRDAAPASSTFGRLSYLEVQVDGVAGVDGLNGAAGVAVPSDGDHVYVVGQLDSAVAVFQRATDGTLSFLEVIVDGAGGATGLGGAKAVAASADAGYLYVSSYLDSGLTVLERNTDSGNPVEYGRLSHVETKRDGVGGVDGLFGATAVAVSADDGGVAVAGALDNGLAVFSRDLTPPGNPSILTSPSHVPGGWSNEPIIQAEWSGATDTPDGSGVAGYSFLFDAAVATDPDESVDLEHTLDPHSTSSAALADGTGYHFHLRTCDHARNCAVTAHLGPFAIDTVSPAAPTGVASTSHAVGVPSFDSTVDMVWSPAVDVGSPASGVAGYSFVFSQDSTPVCNQEVDLGSAATGVASQTLSVGVWYFHLCPVDQAGNWGLPTTAGPFEIQDDGVPPRVLEVAAVAAADPAAISSGAAVDAAVTQFLVTFSKAMNDPPGDADPGDVTNPLGYEIVSAGADGIVQTSGCGAASGDDQVGGFDQVVYDPVENQAALMVTGDTSLALGAYRLVLCSPELEDGNGNPLDGDGDGGGGDDFLLDVRMNLTGLLENPNLDDGVAAWSRSNETHIVVDPADAGDAATSGSLLVNRPGPGDPSREWDYSIAQCVNLDATEEAPFAFGGAVLIEETLGGDPGAASAFATVTFNDAANCSGAQVGSVSTSTVVSDDTVGQWQRFDGEVAERPVAAQSVVVSFVVELPLGEDFPFLAWFDDLRFQVGDRVPPSDPIVTSTSHVAGGFSTLQEIGMEWSGAVDSGGSGIEGYSVLWDQNPTTQPDGTIEVAHGPGTIGASSASLGDGIYYFHLSTCDWAGNCTATVHAGPYGVDTQPPGNPSGVTSPSHPQGGNGTHPVIDMTWTPAVDAAPGGSGVVGYSYEFTTSPSPVCDETPDIPGASTGVASEPLADGTYYFHVCTVDGVGLWSPPEVYGPYGVLDTESPRVAAVTTIAATPDDLLDPEESVLVPVSQLVFTFTEPMYDPPGDSDPGDVTNPANYRLVHAGPDGVVDVTDCLDPVVSDEADLTILDVTYDPATWTSAVRLAGEPDPAPGPCRLFVCGTLPLQDLAGNVFDGDGDGASGDDFLRDFSVPYPNFAENPNFDVALTGWEPAAVAPSSFLHDPADVDMSPFSGSAYLDSVSGSGEVHVVSQCREVYGDPAQLTLEGRVFLSAIAGSLPSVVSRIEYFPAVGCQGGSLGLSESTPVGDTSGQWQELPALVGTVPFGTEAVRISFRFDSGAIPPGEFEAWLDRVSLSADAAVIFLDGFENGDTANWSGVTTP